MKYFTVIFVLVLFFSGLIVFHDAFKISFTHEILSCYINYFTFAHDFYIPECFYSNAFGHFPEYFLEIKGVYRPLITCLFAGDYLIWGMHSFGYRLTNFVIHILNAFLVYLIGKKLIKNKFLSMLGAALFFFHPWNATPVLVLIQRSG